MEKLKIQNNAKISCIANLSDLRGEGALGLLI